jgi:hypothetical protein
MSTKWARFYLPIGAILGIMFCIFGCGNVVKSLGPGNNPTGISSIRTLSIQFDEDQREELFAQVRKFSDKHHLEFSLSIYTNKKADDTFFLVMNGEAFHISAFKSIHAPELDINLTPSDPTHPPSQEFVDELFTDLKSFISKIPNIVIVEEK